MPKQTINKLLLTAKMFLFPLTFYFFFFVLFTYPLIFSFSTHFFADSGDGLQNVWNIWWVNKAITELRQSPWWTNWLHYPYGTTLVAHTLNPINGFISLLLLRFLSLVQAHNVIVILTFLLTGLTTFFLAFYLTNSYWPSIIAGFIFTFSNYHFTHAEGHLNLITMQWLPLFVLFWYILLTKPTITASVLAALALFLVILSDYYYFVYAVLTALILFIWQAVKQRLYLFKRSFLAPFLCFLLISLLTSGPLLLALLVVNKNNNFPGHPAAEFSLDLLAPFIYGAHWRFAALTAAYWSKIPGSIHENSMYVGFSTLFLAVLAWRKRKQFNLNIWFFLALIFLLLSLGPVLHIWGQEVTFLPMPYSLLERLLPPMKISGMPVRMMVMVVLSLAVIAAFGFKLLLELQTKIKWLAVPLLLLMLFEYWPRPMPATKASVPPYVKILAKLPGKKGVIDNLNEPTVALYYQTVHQKPLAFGYIARIPDKVAQKDAKIAELLKKKNFSQLKKKYKFQYLIASPKYSPLPKTTKSWFKKQQIKNVQQLKLLYRDKQVKLYTF